jgi:hypothetical protein
MKALLAVVVGSTFLVGGAALWVGGESAQDSELKIEVEKVTETTEQKTDVPFTVHGGKEGDEVKITLKGQQKSVDLPSAKVLKGGKALALKAELLEIGKYRLRAEIKGRKPAEQDFEIKLKAPQIEAIWELDSKRPVEKEIRVFGNKPLTFKVSGVSKDSVLTIYEESDSKKVHFEEKLKPEPEKATTEVTGKLVPSLGEKKFRAQTKVNGGPSESSPVKVVVLRPLVRIAHVDELRTDLGKEVTPTSASFVLGVEPVKKDDLILLRATLKPETGAAPEPVFFTKRVTSAGPVDNVRVENLEAGKYKFTAQVLRGSLTSHESEPVTVNVPQGGGLAQPIITAVSNGTYVSPFAPPAPAQDPRTEGQVKVYDGYLYLEGEGATGGAQLRFILVEKDETGKKTGGAFLADVLPTATFGKWNTTLQIPGLVIGKKFYYLVVQSQRSGKEANSPELPLLAKALDTLEKPDVDLTSALKETPFKGAIRSKSPSLEVKGTKAPESDVRVLIIEEGKKDPAAVSGRPGADGAWAATLKDLKDGRYRFYAQKVQGRSNLGQKSEVFEVVVRTRGPKVESVIPPNFGTAPGVHQLTVKFSPDDPLEKAAAEDPNHYVLRGSNGSGVFDRGNEPVFYPTKDGKSTKDKTSEQVVFDQERNLVILRFPNLTPDIYRLEIPGAKIKDIFGNVLEQVLGQPGSDFAMVLGKPPATGAELMQELPSVSRGITGTTGPYVEYPEFVKFRKPTQGFNPGDHVETRVVRLYYYRDAHRVAQIINREAKSYNRQAVEVRRRLADQARDMADVQTQERRALERAANEAARLTRQAEKQLEETQKDLSALLAQPVDPKDTAAAERARKEVEALRGQIQALQVEVQAKRAAEVQMNEKALVAGGNEERARAEQFRREVAAAHEDPDTYAPGSPESIDPIRQVSVSVIGEAVIQLRGPLTGMNFIREMINQIDSPAGQVRVAVHTVQVNGERGDRMEKVVGRIQDYIDHSRFLTVQSSLMLRKAVVLVASRRAQEALLTCPEASQAARDIKYLHSFFGKDFIDELQAMDSEFLKSGNKLLSLHSMDTTSLASALFVLALAKNSTRLEILSEFQRMLATDLPADEQNYFDAGGYRKYGKRDRFQLLALNARFQSFLGFFNSDVQGDDTITPLQREFIRLAQILKSRLVTELELKQRVVERALIEERLGRDYLEELAESTKKEKDAEDALEKVNAAMMETRAKVVTPILTITAEAQQIRSLITEFKNLLAELESKLPRPKSEIPTPPKPGEQENGADERMPVKGQDPKEGLQRLDIRLRGKAVQLQAPPSVWKKLQAEVDSLTRSKLEEEVVIVPADVQQQLNSLDRMRAFFKQFLFEECDIKRLGESSKLLDRWCDRAPITVKDFKSVVSAYRDAGEHVLEEADKVGAAGSKLIQLLSERQPNFNRAYQIWTGIRGAIISQVVAGSLKEKVDQLVPAAEQGFKSLLEQDLKHQFAVESAARNRRPLDHKKLLDMLIHEIHDKYVELLEGVRAHTANIDDYIKRLSTALDDDLNTQFYFPAFREVREASRFWDVTLSQIETTSILANNRSYAKVEPQATMEFDLPRRNTVITEAMGGAKALVDTYGALLQDPTFLSLTKLGSGQPTSSLTQGQSGGLVSVRGVLPGLSRLPEERNMSERAPAGLTYGSPLEALIPEPAIYKFETGTGYEIRPVIQPDGQSVVFHFNYMYTTNVREPVRPDEKHLGRVKRHFIDTDVQLGNYELREISRYQVALRAARTARGVPLLEDIPGVGVLFRPLPSAESSLQQNLILGQAVIFPTLFDLMGLRWAPVVADLDPLTITNAEFVVRARRRDLMNRVFDFSSSKVDEALRIPEPQRRTDLYRSQETIPHIHPNGYYGPGLNLRDSHLREGYDPRAVYPPSGAIPSESKEGAIYPPKGWPEAGPGPGIPGPGILEGYVPGPPEKPGWVAPPPYEVQDPLSEPLLPAPRVLEPGSSYRSPAPNPAAPWRPAAPPGKVPPPGPPLVPPQGGPVLPIPRTLVGPPPQGVPGSNGRHPPPSPGAWQRSPAPRNPTAVPQGR